MKTIPISGVIGWDVTEEGIREALKAAKGDNVTFEVSSPGGYIAPGLAIFNMIRNYPGETTARLVGYAMSMASYIPLACNNVETEDNAVYMIHNARGGTWGDHNEILKYGEYLKGLSKVLARKYVDKTGKDEAEVADMMDSESYFFGQDIVDHGFADCIAETQNCKDSASAVAVAQAAFEDCFARIYADPATAKADLTRASAMLTEINFIPPAAKAGHNTKEAQHMDLKALLAANPAAKIEHDAAVASARTEGELAGKAAIAASIEKVAPFLASNSYPQVIRDTAVKVLKGEEAMGTLTGAVAAVDAVREDAKSKEAAAATNKIGETRPDATTPGVIDPTANVDSEDALQAAIERAKGGAI